MYIYDLNFPNFLSNSNPATLPIKVKFLPLLLCLFFFSLRKLTRNSPQTENSYDNNLCQVMAIFMAIAPAAVLLPSPATGFPDFGHVNEKDKRKRALGRERGGGRFSPS